MDPTTREKYVPVIGLEVHAQLSTHSKIYASDSTSFGEAPNRNISVISLAHPGTLPRLNKTAIEFAVRIGFAVQSEISRHQIFDRKNYFYPDLPKGYQLTQDRTPICKGGTIKIKLRDGSERDIKLNRIHLEEDAGKSIHTESESDTLIDFNRAGVALVEIVTEPDLHTAEEAGAVLTEIRKIVRYLGICDGNMEEGSLRCDANVSVMLRGATQLGRKVEVKNMNSIRNVQRAIETEITRQTGLLENGHVVIQETRTFNQQDGKTYGMRLKEELNDYRYFPDPDLAPLVITEQWLEEIRDKMPELPRQRQERYVRSYSIPEYDANVITESKELAEYYEAVCSVTKNFKAAANWMIGPVKSYLNEKNVEASALPLKPEVLAEVISLIDSGKVNFSVASQRIFPQLLKDPARSPLELAQELNLIQDSNAQSILPVVKEVLREFPLKVEEYKNGKKGIVAMFMGEVMKRTKGKADPKLANELLVQQLQEL